MPAPKYNLFALGNNGGRPKVFKSVVELEKKCTEYFEVCVTEKYIVTITGLCLFLGITRQTMHRWIEGKIDTETDVFSDTIKKAVQCVELAYEMKLDSFTFGGAIFALKNINKNDWKDKTEQEVQSTITNVAAAFGGVVSATREPTTDTP
jgi:hypothetical protein